MRNHLWYIDHNLVYVRYRSTVATASDAFIHKVTVTALTHICHDRLFHPRKYVQENMHKSVDGVPSMKLVNPFFHCGPFTKGKMTKMKKGYNTKPTRATSTGQRFNIDFGLVSGKYATKTQDVRILTSNYE